ncbi:MAG: hypothetical protein IT364_04755, partial [Candidatus Hydrogenedentes bacterium]|nr:hypothetical protein [Candidatus Hydrogenedentota bacterium]
MNLRSALSGLGIVSAALALAVMPCDAQAPFRGVHFNPQVRPEQPDFPWLLHYGDCRDAVRIHLRDTVDTLHINFIDFFVLIPHTLAVPPKGPAAGQPVEEWANLTYLDNLAAFLDDCHTLGVSAEIDLACIMWIPSTVDSEHHISVSGVWPKADDTPWDESTTWYRGVIEYVEKRVQHPEAIAMWCMMGHYQWGGAEPVLWDGMPDVIAHTERLVKEVWPAFRSSGKRPKAAPIMLPIFSANDFWSAQPPQARLSAFTNLKKWLVDDLALPPDYWAMTSYPFCDPAPDGFFYLKA